MRTPALSMLAAAVAAISCTVSPEGLGARPGEEPADAGPSGRVSPDPAGFQGLSEDAGRPAPPPAADPLPADAAPPPASEPPLPPPDAGPPPPPPDAAAPPIEARVLRVHDVKVGRLVAGVVHAHQLEAAAGSAGLVLPPDPDALLKLELGTQDVEAAELNVDVLFAHDIKAGVVQIGTTHARIKKKERAGDD